MKKLLPSLRMFSMVAALSLGLLRTEALPLYEPFDYPYVSGETNAVGTTNAGMFTGWSVTGWTSAPTDGSDQVVVTNVNLSIEGLAPSSGNAVTFGGAGWSARVPFSPPVITQNTNGTFSTNSLVVTNGTLYYSMAIRIDDLGFLSSSGGFLAGLNNTVGAQPNNVTVLGAALFTRATLGGFNFGIARRPGTLGNVEWDTTDHQAGETNFIVASYTFVDGGTSNDVCYLWINPDPASFGGPVPPTPTVTAKVNITDLDLTVANSPRTFYLRQQTDTAVPGITVVDEVRVATTWACVTPPAGAPAPTAPTLEITRSGTDVIFSWLTNQTCFTLESTAAIPADPYLWRAVTGPIGIVGDKFSVTNSAASGNRFFRLRSP